MSTKTYHLVLLGCFVLSLIISGIHPHDSFTWFLEVLPGIILVGVLTAVYFFVLRGRYLKQLGRFIPQ
jgi:putative membrane protein